MKLKKLSENIIKTFKKNGFVLSEPDVLLDSDYIIERSGEKFRSSMFTFKREDGKTMCLRPDLTVASCISFLEKKSSSKIYYSGQAYRRSSSKNSSFINNQLGIEILGSKNKIQDDYKVISTILRSAKKISRKKIQIKVGDISLFKSLINALEMPERWKLRLIKHFWRPSYFKELLKRFDKKIRDPRSFSNGKKIVKIIKSFLKINCKLSEIDEKLLIFAKKNNLKKNIFKDFKSIQNLQKLNEDINFIVNFGRDVEYYTGIVFEIFSGKIEIGRGGRYDNLLKSLGASKNIPAVGAAINLKNL